MKVIPYKQVVNDYNKKHGTNDKFISCSSLELDSIICDLYDFESYDLDEDNSCLILYNKGDE